MFCSIAVFKDYLKINFFQSAHLTDTKQLFNACLEAKESWGIDLFKGGNINIDNLVSLIKIGVEYNLNK